MSYKSDTIASILPRINTSFFLPALQREFVWTSGQICALFDSLMRRYPISSFLLWHVPGESRDDVEAYEFLHTVNEFGNRARMARVGSNSDLTFVLDGQQRLTALLVGLQGTFYARRTKSGKGARTNVSKKLFLDLLHDGREPDAEGEVYYKFEFYDYEPTVLRANSYWFEVRKILRLQSKTDLEQLVERQIKAIRDMRSLSTQQANVVSHNLTRLYDSVITEETISYHTEIDADHERILEIFVRANSGGTQLSKSDLLLSTLTLHWGTENAREEINRFVEELNNDLTRKNKLNKDFVMKSCLVLLNLPVAYRVSSFTKDTCTRIKHNWHEIRDATLRAVDAANAFGIDEANLTSANALIPISYYLYHQNGLTLRGESSYEVTNAARVRVWLLSALLNRVLSGSSDTMLTKLRDALQRHSIPRGDFPVAALDEAVRTAGRISATSEDALENVMEIEYGDSTCFLALSLLYDERNWGTIQYSIDHLFSRDSFKKPVPDHLRELRDDFGNLALVIGNENSGKNSIPLAQWLSTRTPEYLTRHLIPEDPSLWQIANYEQFLIERRKLIRNRLKKVFGTQDEVMAGT